MSFRAQEWAYGLRGLTGPEKAVLNCLAWHHNAKTGLCCPGNPLIADETCLGLSTVKKGLVSLIAKGLISRMPWRRGSAYMLAITEPAEATTEPVHIEQELNQNARERASLDFDLKEDIPPAVRECVALLRGGQRERDLSHRFGADEIAQARKVLVAARRPGAMGLMRSIAPETKKPAGSAGTTAGSWEERR